MITEDEKIILKNLPKEFKYIVRDRDGLLILFRKRPHKVISCNTWYCNIDYYKESEWDYFKFYNHLFKFIKWEDKKPYKIKELLNE